MNSKKHESNIMSKILKTIYYSIITVLCLFVVLIIFYMVSTKLNTNPNYKPKVSMYTIVSPSMTPVIKVYDVVVNVRPKTEKDIQIGDIITYISRVSTSDGMTITHRVIEIREREDGSLEYITQGDNNTIPDSLPVPFEDVIGNEILIIPYLGKAQFLISNNKGWLILLLIPVAIYLIKDILTIFGLFGLSKKIDKISKKDNISKEIKYIKEQERKEEIKNRLNQNELEKLSLIRSSKEPSGFLDNNNETIVIVKENKYRVAQNKNVKNLDLKLSPKPKKEVLKSNDTKMNNKIEEYNNKIAELNKMIKKIEEISKKQTQKTKKEEVEEIINEKFLEGKKIKVTNVESATKKTNTAIKNELPNLKKNIAKKLNLNPNEIKKVNRKNKAGTLKKVTKKVPVQKRQPIISIVKK